MSRPPAHRRTRRSLLLCVAGLLLAVVAVLPGSARADRQPRLELAVDTRELQVGQTITAQIQLIDGVYRDRPDLPVGAGLQARFTGQGSQHVMVNFESTRITSYNFALTAVQPGTWEIGPVSIPLGSRVLTADPVSVTVRPRDAAQERVQDVLATVSDTEPYLGEVVVYTFRHQHLERLLDLDWTPPAFDGFVAEKVAEASQREYRIQQDGTTYGVEEIAIPLVATAVGPRVIPPAVVSAKVPARNSSRRRSPFLSSVDTLTLASEPLSLRTRPLPEAGRPADFSGLVGRFRLDAVARKEGSSGALRPGEVVEIPLGQSLTVEVTLSGDGTLAGVQLPDPPADAGYRAYDDSPEIAARLDEGRLSSVATFRRAVVPEAEGELTVPPVQLSVFDPEREAYVTLKTEPITLRVLPGEAGAGEVRRFGDTDGGSTPDTRAEVESLGEDILPVAGAARVRDRSLEAALPWAVALPALPALGLLLLGIDGARRRRAPDPRAELRRAIADLPADPAARLAALEDAFRVACGLRLSAPAPGLTRDAVAPLGDDAVAIYDALGRARYGGFQPGGDLEGRVRAFVEAT